MPSRSHPKAQRRRLRCGFTLVELLIVVAIIGLVIGLVLPAVQAARESARRTHCTNNLRQLGVALHLYHEAQGRFPVGCTDRPGLRHCWITDLLPHLEQQPVWDRYHWGRPSRSKANQPATGTVLPLLLCPSTVRTTWDRPGLTTGDKNRNGSYDFGDQMAFADYGGIFGDGRPGAEPLSGMLVWDEPVALRQVKDGTSKTIIVAEDTGRGYIAGGEWANGENIFDVTKRPNVFQQDEMWSDHPGGAQALLVDGAVRFVPDTIDIDLLSAFCTRAGGEVVSVSQLEE